MDEEMEQADGAGTNGVSAALSTGCASTKWNRPSTPASGERGGTEGCQASSAHLPRSRDRVNGWRARAAYQKPCTGFHGIARCIVRFCRAVVTGVWRLVSTSRTAKAALAQGSIVCPLYN